MSTSLSVDIRPTLGVGYLGVAVCSTIYGIASLQAFQYYISARAKTDRRAIHALVGTLWILGTLRQALMIYTFYYYLILHSADLVQTLVENVWGIGASVILTAIITFIADCFLIMRIWHMSAHNTLVCVVCAILALSHFILATTYASLQLSRPQDSVIELEAWLEPLGVGSAAVGAITDVLVMAALSFYLLRSRSGVRRTDDMVATLVVYTIITGALCGCFSVASFVTYLALPHSFFNLIFSVLGAELYINVLLTSLNSRETIRRGLEPGICAPSESIHLSNIAFQSRPHRGAAVTDNSGASTTVDTSSTYLKQTYLAEPQDHNA
ncbi:hypothetical protein C8Q80DRAFT_1174887 [Daedaleopsis nitida]|nr:hypothetical protein C8Q80DRAFT_1174887 [Daedaleopsis nitida]